MKHKIQLDLKICFDSPWHAGSGEGSLVVDRLIRRDVNNKPYVPASTLKGIIRQSCEKLCRTLGFPDPTDPHQSDLSQTSGKGFVPISKMQSPIDRLFGTRFESEGLFFRDARMQKKSFHKTLTRNRVALYRVLGTAREKHLFNTEYCPPGCDLTLQTKINGWHNQLASFVKGDPPYAYCLLMAGILAVERIGGDKSTGAGWLLTGIEIEKATYNESEVDMEEVFEFLDPGFYKHSRGEK